MKRCFPTIKQVISHQTKGYDIILDFMEIIKTRRSIRKFEDKDVPQEMLHQLLSSVQWAPSWANTQCWEIIVIRDLQIKEKLQKVISPKNPATKAIVDAPVLLAFCGKLKSSGYYKDKVSTQFGDWFMFDLGLAAQNLSLTAHYLGLGSVMVGLFDHEKAGDILRVPDGYALLLLMPLGYPAKTPSAPKRRKIAEFTHQDGFNG
jgi:nitroreductase